MKKFILFASAIVVIAFLSACGSSNDNTDTITADSPLDSAAMMSEGQQEYITIPAPDEMFSFMKDIGGAGKSTTHLSNPNNYKNYVDTKYQALNFGIYATDFLYCSIFDYGPEALKYFVNVKKLGDGLGISGVINEKTADRIKKNIGKNDSLTDISNTLYFSSISELEKTDKASILALVIVGGWIESLNIVTNMTKEYKADNPAIIRISEQKYTLDNLLGYLDKYKSDANVTSVIEQLNELKAIFDRLKEETTSGTVSLQGNKKVLGGGTQITMTEEQYKAITEKVKSIHNSFTIVK